MILLLLVQGDNYLTAEGKFYTENEISQERSSHLNITQVTSMWTHCMQDINSVECCVTQIWQPNRS